MDKPENLTLLKDALAERYDRTIDFISDPNFDLIEDMEMKNQETAYRGFGLIDKNGEFIFTEIDDYWGENFDDTLSRIKSEYEKLQ